MSIISQARKKSQILKCISIDVVSEQQGFPPLQAASLQKACKEQCVSLRCHQLDLRLGV